LAAEADECNLIMRKQFLRILIGLILLVPGVAKAQFETFKDSVVQLYGVVMTADSLMAIPAVSILIKGQNRGTMTSERGVFSIVVLKGEVVEFTSVGFKPQTVEIPRNLQGNQYSIIQLMVNDTIYLPVTVIKPRLSREQFERDFLKTKVPDDALSIARQNNNEASRSFLMATMPVDGREATARYMRQYAAKLCYSGQVPPMNIFNPAAWAEFIQAWKRGDFRKKKL